MVVLPISCTRTRVGAAADELEVFDDAVPAGELSFGSHGKAEELLGARDGWGLLCQRGQSTKQEGNGEGEQYSPREGDRCHSQSSREPGRLGRHPHARRRGESSASIP